MSGPVLFSRHIASAKASFILDSRLADVKEILADTYTAGLSGGESQTGLSVTCSVIP